MRPGPVEGLWTVDHGGGGETTRMVCGFIESSEFLFAPVFRSLPPLLIDRTGDDKVSALITSTVREILVLADAAAPGTELMLGRLMELLFVEVVRRYAARLPPSAKGWFAALNDPIVGRALQSVHRDPARRWTVDELAREAGTSRTVLAERFNAVFGQAPIEYVTGWRMQLAAERMRNSKRQPRRHRRRRRLRVRSRVQPRLQARDRHHAGPLARRRNREPLAAVRIDGLLPPAQRSVFRGRNDRSPAAQIDVRCQVRRWRLTKRKCFKRN